MSNESTLGAVSVAVVGFLIQGFGLMIGILIAYGLYKWVSKDKKDKDKEEKAESQKNEGSDISKLFTGLFQALGQLAKQEEKKPEPPPTPKS